MTNSSKKGNVMLNVSPQCEWTLLSQGAEARVWKVPTAKGNKDSSTSNHNNNHNSHNDNDNESSSSCSFVICKERFVKLYRHPELDAKLTKSRCRSEARLLEKCVKLGLSLFVPAVMKVDPPKLFLEFVNGPNLKTFLQRKQQQQQQQQHHISQRKRPPKREEADDDKNDDDGNNNYVNDIDYEKDEGYPHDNNYTLPHDDKKGDSEDPFAHYLSPLFGIAYDDLAQRIGTLIGQLHNIDIIHGDLTTSNMLLVMTTPMLTTTITTETATTTTTITTTSSSSSETAQPSNTNIDTTAASASSSSWRIMLIDFGLGKSTTSIEEHAVDLYVLERALQSTHPELPSDFMDRLLHEYAKIRHDDVSKSGGVLKRLDEVRKRGRKRECFG
jgi:TP53 regulating kinase and related kinases